MLECRQWESAKEPHKHYRRREPEKSELYRVVQTYRDELPRVWEELYQSEYGALRKEVLTALDEYLNCGLLCHGAARVYCDTCKHSLLVAFSCKKRGICPSCSAKRAVLFAEHLQNEVLSEDPNRHVVFTIPKRLRVFFRYDRSLSDILFTSAWAALKEVLSDSGTLGAVLTLQTAGDALNWNPHIHGALTDGTYQADGSFKRFSELSEVVTIKVTELFRDNVLSGLRAKELIDDGVVTQILSQEHSGFGVWLGEPFSDKKSSLFVARYIERGPVSLERLSIQDDIITYTNKDGVAHDFSGLDFLALLSSHIPNRGESLTRYYGYYSSRGRGERAKVEKLKQASFIGPVPEPEAKPSSSWACSMKRVFEFNPLECPKCKGTMRIIAFLHDPKEISKIMASLHIPQPEPPVPVPRAPGEDPCVDEVFPETEF